MAIFGPKHENDDIRPSDSGNFDVEKKDSIITAVSREKGEVSAVETQALHRSLRPRHISMIAIAGSIGTGLIIGTGSALADAGPASILIAYSVVGFVVYLVLCALGEMATWIPQTSGFAGYAGRFVDPAFGFALGYT
jgi:amino acid transporter